MKASNDACFKTRERIVTDNKNAVQLIFLADDDNRIMTTYDEWIQGCIEEFDCAYDVIEEEDDEYDYRVNFIFKLENESLDEYKRLHASLSRIESARDNVIVNLFYDGKLI